ncbi:hypothetical protein M3Y99_00900800 [Aphelenchoides fujianensis]|nr:hypothetical protein M3Y99_00900800 [Aphelenchoides fujianensis]
MTEMRLMVVLFVCAFLPLVAHALPAAVRSTANETAVVSNGTSPKLPFEMAIVRAYREGFQDGRKEGFERGHQQGNKTGYEAGLNEGWDQGYDFGKEISKSSQSSQSSQISQVEDKTDYWRAACIVLGVIVAVILVCCVYCCCCTVFKGPCKAMGSDPKNYNGPYYHVYKSMCEEPAQAAGQLLISIPPPEK